MLLLVLAMCFAVSDLFAADNYQLLRSSPAGYAPVVPGKNIQFPRDHLPHSAFKIEWWYLTANLTDDSGGEYGVHWTLFRQSMSPDEARRQLVEQSNLDGPCGNKHARGASV